MAEKKIKNLLTLKELEDSVFYMLAKRQVGEFYKYLEMESIPKVGKIKFRVFYKAKYLTCTYVLDEAIEAYNHII